MLKDRKAETGFCNEASNRELRRDHTRERGIGRLNTILSEFLRYGTTRPTNFKTGNREFGPFLRVQHGIPTSGHCVSHQFLPSGRRESCRSRFRNSWVIRCRSTSPRAPSLDAALQFTLSISNTLLSRFAQVIARIEDPVVIRKILAYLDAKSASAGIRLFPESRGLPQTGLLSGIHHANDLLR